MNLKALFWDTRLHVAFTLTLVWLLTLVKTAYGQHASSVILPLVAIVTITACDVAITYLRSRKALGPQGTSFAYWPFSSLVSGLLIGLIIDPKQPIWVFALAAILASLSKQFIGAGNRRHIFNPAAFGIMAVSIFFQVPVSWWAVAWGNLPLIILIPLMARILWRLKRLTLPATFLIIYYLYLLTLMSPKVALNTLIDGSFLLFALIMLPEPITSPIVGKFKYFFGILVAILAILISKFLQIGEVFLPALLMGNFISFMVNRFQRLSISKVGNR